MKNSGHGNPSPRGKRRHMGPNPGSRPAPVAGPARGHGPGGSHDPDGCAVIALVGVGALLAAGLSGPVALLSAYLMA